MSENSTLRIHTQMTPEPARPAREERSRRRRGRREARRPPVGTRPGFGDRLLRNSAIACAVLLGILALGNLRQPWAEKAAQGIERALSMRIDLDDPIGELTFVRRIMPESALVFLNVSGGSGLARPAAGALTHPWSAAQPWLMFAEGEDEACAVAGGTVTAVSPLSGGKVGLIVDHGEGLESVYANLDAAEVQSGEAVERGQLLGGCGSGLYFELRQDGEAVDPTERLGL